MKFDNVSEFETSLDAVDLDLGNGRVITVRHMGLDNLEYRRASQQYVLKHRRAITNDTHPIEAADRAEMDMFARHVVTGWRGFRSGASEVPFTVQACVALFEQAPALFDQVREEAQRLANFRAEDAEAGTDALKKS